MKRFFILFAAVALVAVSCGKSTTTVNPGGGAPTVTTTGPANGATDVQRNVTVTATFSAAMDPATLTAASFQLTIQF